jgi:phosphohistidine swiveling domain-containing protein
MARQCQIKGAELMRYSFIASVAFATHPQQKQKITRACELDDLLEAIQNNTGSDELEKRFGFFSNNPYDLTAPRLAQMNLAEIRFTVPADPRMRVRENVRLVVARYLEIERRALEQLSRERDLGPLIFFLDLTELETMNDFEKLRRIALQRQNELEKNRDWPSPWRFVIANGRFMTINSNAGTSGQWKGYSVGEKNVAAGKAVWIRSPGELKGDFSGRIIVCDSLFPELTIVYGKCAGIVCASGGWMAHAAVVAREMKVICICQVQGLDSLKDGQWVSVDGANGTIRLIAPE